MVVIFSQTPEARGIRLRAEEKRLLSRRLLPPSLWSSLSGAQQSAARFVQGALDAGTAEVEGDEVLLFHEAAATATGSIARILGLPDLAGLSLTLSLDSRVEAADGRIRCVWRDSRFSEVTPKRHGTILLWGQHQGRLTAELHQLVSAIDHYNGTLGLPSEARIAAWASVQAALRLTTGAQVTTDAVLGSFTIYQAGSFALDVRERPASEGPDFVPVLMAREKAVSLEDDAPAVDEGGEEGEASSEARLRDAVADALLPPELQAQFLTMSASLGATRDSYVLGRNQFVVLAPELKVALDVVRRKRHASAQERRAFIRNPRPALAEALDTAQADLTAAQLFVETRQYSERVLGLGLWDPPKTPWIRKTSAGWLPERFSLEIGERRLELTPDSFDALVAGADAARAAGEPTLDVDGERFDLGEVEHAIAPLRDAGKPSDEAPAEQDEATGEGPERLVLQIKTNVEQVDYAVSRPARPLRIARDMPVASLGTTPKDHQRAGFDWLVAAWTSGWPGVLLADDMGLGKTFQALAFLAWIRTNQQASRRVPAGPILVVAPTALLRNWVAEAERHLAPGALGERVDAFGPQLARLKRPKSRDLTPEDSLDTDRMKDAGWILTTYETLADNHRAFARIGYAVAVFDEMQKIKAPGTINTHAAKAMNADFVLGLTGTPIENRLEDLWCIVDRVAPGYLGDLKSFSAAHTELAPARLAELKARLDQPQAGAPPIMLRRMKEQILDGLPEKRVISYPLTMPAPQADAYAVAVREAHAAGRTPQAMLKAVHTLRGISLHPDGRASVDGYDPRAARDWVERSARTRQIFELLTQIQAMGEKALVFIEDRHVQDVFVAAAATLLGLPRTPSIINGEVPGDRRHAIVTAFQTAPRGFDLLVLGPKSAGVGLTITAANHVLHLSRWWNPAVEDQCNDRVYRIGQTRPVTVHVPIAVHPEFGDASFDVTLDALLARKRALSRDMLSPPVSDGDLREMFGATVDAGIR